MEGVAWTSRRWRAAAAVHFPLHYDIWLSPSALSRRRRRPQSTPTPQRQSQFRASSEPFTIVVSCIHMNTHTEAARMYLPNIEAPLPPHHHRRVTCLQIRQHRPHEFSHGRERFGKTYTPFRVKNVTAPETSTRSANPSIFGIS